MRIQDDHDNDWNYFEYSFPVYTHEYLRNTQTQTEMTSPINTNTDGKTPYTVVPQR